jgi:DNA-binding transcriptional regulator YiaG
LTPSQIAALRKKLDPSPTAFGIKIGYAEASARISVWKLENGKRKPSGPTLVLMKQLASRKS